jgi:hypothetical protein
MCKNIMVDLEALDSAHSATIISIGMVYFDLGKMELGPELYIELDREALKEQLELGRSWSLATTQWWMQQSDSAREVWASKIGQVCNKEFIKQLKEYFEIFPEHGRNIRVWGNGSTYDNICLQSYLRTFKARIPWNYKGDVCYRTIKTLFGHRAKLERIGTHHNGLDDAKTQAVHLMKMLKNIPGVV